MFKIDTPLFVKFKKNHFSICNETNNFVTPQNCLSRMFQINTPTHVCQIKKSLFLFVMKQINL